jgi:colanic acid biosynthesis glycosyl transferase WcaI
MPSKLGNILASGKPLIAGAEPNTQIYDAIQGCGIAVEPENVQQFADAIVKLADDKALRDAMGEVGRQRAQADWSRDGVLVKLEKLFKGVASEVPAIVENVPKHVSAA